MLVWTQPLLAQLGALWQHQQLAPSLLISGDVGIGVSKTAQELADLLRCRNQDNGERCQKCHDCRLINAGTHPDFLRIAAEEGKKQIGIDLVRKANEFATTRPQVARCKVILIDQAERLNTASANAILKTLEEPASGVVFLLACERPGQLLPTIRSRCQSYVVPTPSQADSMAFLADHIPDAEQAQKLLLLARSRPLMALDLQDSLESRDKLLNQFSELINGRTSVVEAAGIMAKVEQEHLMVWLQAWLVDLVKASLGQHGALQDPQGLVTLVEKSLPADKLMRWSDQQINDISALRRGMSLNLQSWLEAMLIDLTTMLWREG